MLLLLTEAIKRAGSDLLLFQTAFKHVNHQDGDIWNELAQWRMHSVVPPFVRIYLKYLYGV